MNNAGVYLGAMSISTVNTSKMVNFYETVFKTRMKPHAVGNYTMYRGNIGGLDLTLTPNDLMGIRAEQSKHHFSFVVPNLEEYIRLVESAGGQQIQDIDIDYSEKYCEVVDPDGNAFELVEKMSDHAF